ncbi:MAG TPA: class I SAM-dependent methyltransferase [Opitutaceae bacterium]|nr:class I SAM-dependent methyltransferase [Opitutaceae bacterium]
MSTQANYGRVASVYRWLEYLAFGRTLQHSRTAFFERLGDCRSIGIFGAGDGRCFEPLLRAAPRAEIESIDIDPQFIALARERVAALPTSERIRFIQADARTWSAPSAKYDAVLTQYFLDCFTPGDLNVVVAKLAQSLSPDGEWLFADFSIPEKPAWARWRGRLWIFLLCTFFRWRADHPLRTLPPMHAALSAAGFEVAAQKTWSHGLVRAAVYRRSPSV